MCVCAPGYVSLCGYLCEHPCVFGLCVHVSVCVCVPVCVHVYVAICSSGWLGKGPCRPNLIFSSITKKQCPQAIYMGFLASAP